MALHAVDKRQLPVSSGRESGDQALPPAAVAWHGEQIAHNTTAHNTTAHNGGQQANKPDRDDGHNCCNACGQPLGYWATDRLTGLPDRWGWDNHAPRAHNDAVAQRRPIALLAIDLDRFKRINDDYGHPAGDAVLQSAATVLRYETRETDLVSRYGGDEFLILTTGTDFIGALALARRICDGIRATATTARATYDWTVTIKDLTASVGVAVQYPEDGFALFDLLLQADTALRHAKRQGRDLVCIANSTTQAEITYSLSR